MEADSIDAVVTDPPAGINFMSKPFDSDRGGRVFWVEWLAEIMSECLRILKPGGHALVWALPRTSHWTATAVEDAGFELRDCIYHLFGSGFPKSLDVSKAIDKASGADREIVGTWQPTGTARIKGTGNSGNGYDHGELRDSLPITAPATPEAAQWDGWGTALKPAVECWWLCRKPLSESTVAANVLRWGTGAINVDGCRIAAPGGLTSGGKPNGRSNPCFMSKDVDPRTERTEPHAAGRWPSHLLLSHSLWCTDDGCDESCPVAGIDRQSGSSRSRIGNPRRSAQPGDGYGMTATGAEYDDQGGASRYFYCAKASRSERDAGLADLPLMGVHPPSGDGRVWDIPGSHSTPRRNVHPTVKPLALMRYLCRLITPPGGLILDPFAGSGSTGVAAIRRGVRFVGVEREPEYVEIANRRIDATA